MRTYSVDNASIFFHSFFSNSYCSPCGACRQFLMEFADADTVVIGQDGDEGEVIVDSLCALLPKSFKLK